MKMKLTVLFLWTHVVSSISIPLRMRNNVDDVIVGMFTSSTISTTSPVVTTVQQEWTAAEYPNPQTQPERCGRRGSSWICDPNGVVSYEQANRLDEIINDIRSRARCVCDSCPSDGRGRYGVAVAFLNKLNLQGAEPTESNIQRAIENFALDLRQIYWRFGYCQDGVVIVVSRQDRRVWTSVGVVARRRLPNGCVNHVYERVRGIFRDNRFYDGVKEMLNSYRTVLLGGSCRGATGLSIGAIIGIVFGVIGGVAMIVSLILCCVGMKLNWECVTGTCIGVCIGCILGAIQACINAIIISICQSICEALGCEECCEPIQCDCLGDEGYTSNDGGGGGGGGF